MPISVDPQALSTGTSHKLHGVSRIFSTKLSTGCVAGVGPHP